MALSFNFEQGGREMGRGFLSMKVCDCWIWECLRGASLLLEDQVEGESGNEGFSAHRVTPPGEAGRYQCRERASIGLGTY